jgi:hypothetical protein
MQASRSLAKVREESPSRRPSPSLSPSPNQSHTHTHMCTPTREATPIIPQHLLLWKQFLFLKGVVVSETLVIKCALGASTVVTNVSILPVLTSAASSKSASATSILPKCANCATREALTVQTQTVQQPVVSTKAKEKVRFLRIQEIAL